MGTKEKQISGTQKAISERLRDFQTRFFLTRSAMEDWAGLKHGTAAGWFNSRRTRLPQTADLVRLAQPDLAGGARLNLHWLLLGEGSPLRRESNDILWTELREELVTAVGKVVKEPRSKVAAALASETELEARLVIDAVSAYLHATRPKEDRSKPKPKGWTIGAALGDYLDKPQTRPRQK